MQVFESGSVVWNGRAYVPGTSGITSAYISGTGAVVVDVGSGNYTFLYV